MTEQPKPGFRLIKMPPERVVESKVFPYYIRTGLPELERENHFRVGSILRNIAEGKMDFWVALDVLGEQTRMLGYITTSLSADSYLYSPTLIIITFTWSQNATKEHMKKGLATLLKYAESKGAGTVSGLVNEKVTEFFGLVPDKTKTWMFWEI